MTEGKTNRVVYVGLPAYNEAAAISPLLGRVEAARIGLINRGLVCDLQIIFYDDGSTDDTAQCVRESHRGTETFVLSPPSNGGLGVALEGIVNSFLRMATNDDVLVVMDCDDTHDPHQIAELLSRMDRFDEDVVIASRYRKGAVVAGVSWNRQLLSFGFAVLVKIVLPIRGVRDYSCGYRAYAKAPLMNASGDRGFRLQEPGFSAMPEILMRLRPGKWKFGEIPLVLAYDRRLTQSKMRAWKNSSRLVQCLVSWRLRPHQVSDYAPLATEPLGDVSVEMLRGGESET